MSHKTYKILRALLRKGYQTPSFRPILSSDMASTALPEPSRVEMEGRMGGIGDNLILPPHPGTGRGPIRLPTTGG